ncbi:MULTISPECIES: tetratricopeptide repeat protein [Streptomyces violaceusniger group]|uniref:Nucleoside phosphorylase domain-containing protein n=2 Tax=Streptomyces rhizosphaericus TaxID=114699 RepID=A0ABN1S671_9ACTN|nr:MULTISPECIES: tetratricopeptide repeat protein [Streptomyces violaceusniger group]
MGAEVWADVVVLTALEVEYRAVRAHLEDLRPVPAERGALFELGVFREGSGERTVAIHMTGPGNPGAGVSVERAAALFAPRAVLFVGVAGGVKDVALGDVVAADAVYDYETGKDTETGFLPRQKTYQSAYGLVQLARLVAAGDEWQERVRPGDDAPRARADDAPCPRTDAAPRPRAHVKPLAAGGRVVAHHRSDTGLRLAASAGDALAVDMEGFGFLAGAYANQQVDALVIRGISDLLGDKAEAHDEHWQPVASRHAAAFAFELISRIPVADPAAARPLDAPTRPDALVGGSLSSAPGRDCDGGGRRGGRRREPVHPRREQLDYHLDHGGCEPGRPFAFGSTPARPGAVPECVPGASGGRVIAQHSSLAVGYAEQVRFQGPVPQPAGWPHQVGLIPPRALAFQSRAVAEQLHQALRGEDTAVLGQVLSGLGGVGKTQLAADYARIAWEHGELDVLVWVTASSRETVVAGYTQAAVELLAVEPDEHAAGAFLAWLQPTRGRECRWLMVLDDVTDPADMRGLWPPSNPHGRTLATTRRRDAALIAADRRLLSVGLFTPEEATAHLGQALADHHRHAPADQIHALAADLGYLPLALSQATAYLMDTGISCARYRELLADRTRALSDLLPEPGILPDDQTTTVAATWSLSIERAERLRPQGLARPMLQLLAMLDPSGIPESVVTSAPALGHLARHHTSTTASVTTGPEPGPVTQEEAVGALRALHRLSLIDHTPDTPHLAIRVHHLIQRATWDSLLLDHGDQVARTAADALVAAWPGIERDTALVQALRANTTALTRTAEDALYRPDAHAVLYRAGESLGGSGQVSAARDYFQHLATEASRHLDSDHLNTFEARSHLAHWQGEAGDVAGAATAFAELLPDMVRVLEPDRFITVASLANSAYWRGKAGDVAGAATAFAELLPDMVRVLGPDDLEILKTRYNLVYWRKEAGDAAGAAAAYAELLSDVVRVLGPDHPFALTTRCALACSRGDTGDAAGAVTGLAELLADQEAVLGPDHLDTLTTQDCLARYQGEAGDAAGAATAYAGLLPDMLRVLGPDHPQTLSTASDSAYWRGKAGDVAGAATAFAELLPDMVQVLGPDHPDTLTTRYNLAYWRGEAGDAAGAATAFAELLPDMVQVLGPDHPETLSVRCALAWSRGGAGDAAGAVTALAELLADQETVLGPDHPTTVTTRQDLTYWQGNAGNGHKE